MVPQFLLCCLGNRVFLSGALATDADQNHDDVINAEDGLNVINADTVKQLIREEVVKSWSKIVSSLQRRLAAQDRRIWYRETRDKRRQIVVNQLVLK